MPVQVSYPGVYIQEVPSGVHTITGVSTSIAAFIGRTAKGPLDKAIRCLSLADFNRSLGGPHPESQLGQAVRMFFGNGGADCYVVRLASGAQKASVTLTDLSGNGVANHSVLTIRAKTPGLWGNGLRMEVDFNTANPDETFNLTIIYMDGGNEITRERHSALSMDPSSARFAPVFVTQSSELVDIELHANAKAAGPIDINAPTASFAGYSQGRVFATTPIAGFRTQFQNLLINGPKFKMNVDDNGYIDVDLSNVLGTTPPEIDPTSAWTLSAMASRIQEVINQQLDGSVSGLRVKVEWKGPGPLSPTALRITADSGRKRSVRIRRGTDHDFASPMMLGLDQGGIESARFSDYRPVPTAAVFSDPEKILTLASIAYGSITTIAIDGGAPISFTLPPLPGPPDLWATDQSGWADGIREKLKIIAAAVNGAASVPWTAEVWGYHLAIKAKDGSSNKIPASVVSAADPTLGGANFTRNVKQYSLSNTGTSSFQQLVPPGDVGADGTAPGLAEFVGDEATQTGLHALDPVDLFNLMVIPADEGIPAGVHESLWSPASNYCEQRRAMLLIDPPASWTDANGRPAVKNDTTLISTLRATVVKDNSAVFYPRVQYVEVSGLKKYIGPGGAIAGLMARTDSSRGVWKAPAGTEADIRGIVGLEVKLTDLENGVLNKKAVSCLRAFPVGFVSWGARTLHGDDDDGSEWKYIPIRRLALFLEESLFRGTKWVVFEPNDEPLWAKIRLNLNAFMMSLFRQGAFQGSTPDKAFFVKCDGETTTQNDRNLGIVNIEVGFAPLKPAEFVIIKIQQIAGEL